MCWCAQACACCCTGADGRLGVTDVEISLLRWAFPALCESQRRWSAKEVGFSFLFFWSFYPQQKCREKRILIAASVTIRAWCVRSTESQGVCMGVSVTRGSPRVEGDCDRLQGAPWLVQRYSRTASPNTADSRWSVLGRCGAICLLLYASCRLIIATSHHHLTTAPREPSEKAVRFEPNRALHLRVACVQYWCWLFTPCPEGRRDSPPFPWYSEK